MPKAETAAFSVEIKPCHKRTAVGTASGESSVWCRLRQAPGPSGRRRVRTAGQSNTQGVRSRFEADWPFYS